MTVPIFFNLLANSTFSMAAGLLVVLFFLWFFKIQSESWKLFFLSLPFVKIVFDCFKGVPADSVLYAGLDPFTLPPRHQILSIGAGIRNWGPDLSVAFSVKDLNGKEFAVSIGDYLVIWLNRKFGQNIPMLIVALVCVAALTLLVVRLIHSIQFEQKRRQDRKLAETFRLQEIGKRNVDVYISGFFSGTPFTGGVLKPYICIPKNSYTKLEKSELEAVIFHEIGHIRQFDLVVTIFIQLLGDIFWFIPGYRMLSRKIDRLREIVADQWVIKSGLNPLFLASALVKLKEIPEPAEKFVLYSAFFREKSLLKVRVDRLLAKPKESRGRFGWQNKWIRYVATFWILIFVMFSTLGGNQKAHGVEDMNTLDSILRFWELLSLFFINTKYYNRSIN